MGQQYEPTGQCGVPLPGGMWWCGVSGANQVIGSGCPIYGCMDETATNYNENATVEENCSCEYEEVCTIVSVTGGSFPTEVSWNIEDDNGNKKMQTIYRNGLKNGKQINWTIDGSKISEFSFKSGNRNGSFKTWYENGRKQMKIGYVNGVPRGRAKFWFPDGSLKGEGIVRSEVPGGGWILLDPDGNKKVYK